MNNRISSFTMRVLPQLIAGLMAGGASLAYAEGTALEEVIVTAQKRAENLQDVPISVQALNSQALEKSGIVSLSDIKANVPGLTIDTYPGSAEILYPSIRGIVPNAVLVSVPIPMAVHVDGVALTQLAGLDLAGADLERIEVLKGPQGVLSGRNATGGAINIVTVKPDLNQFGFKQQITVAERGQWLSKTVVNVPLSENFAAKVSYLHSERDNLGVKNSAPGGPKLGEKTADSWRLDLRWKAANNVMVDYGFDYAKAESIELPKQCLVPFLSGATPFLSAADPRINSFVNSGACSSDKLDHLNVPFQIPKNKNIGQGHNLTINWDIDPKTTFRSITGYREVDTSNSRILSGFGANPYLFRQDTAPVNFVGGNVAPYDGQNHPLIIKSEAWSQEFQLLGDVSDNLKYTAGVYYASDKASQRVGPAITYTVPDVMYLGSFNPADIGTDMFVMSNYSVSTKNSTWAVFGQLSWRPDVLDRKLEIVPGIRYTKDHRKAVGTNQRDMYFYTATAVPGVLNHLFTVPGDNYVGLKGDNDFSKSTPSVSFNYHWKDDLMTYLKVAKGYVTGGFDIEQTPSGFVRGFEPETITSVELGWKGEFLDRRLRVNGAVFRSKYENEQKTTVHPNNVWAVENIGTSIYRGGELDVTAKVTQAFRVSANATWLSHEYAKWIDLIPGPTYGTDVAANRKLIVPNVSYAINLDYRFPDFGLPGKLDGNLNFSYRGAQSVPIDTTSSLAEQYFTTPKFNVVNARLALTNIRVGPSDKGDLTVALWAKNLADKKYQNMSVPTGSADYVTTWSEPRTYGIDLIYNY